MKKGITMVTIDKNATFFCRWTIALLFWISAITLNYNFVLVAAIIMFFSGLLGVDKAPLILLYDNTFGRIIKKRKDVLNVQSIRFSHYVGTIMSVLALLFAISPLYIIGWIIIGMLVVLQTVAALGYCSAQKLYECQILGNNCCNLGKKLRGGKCNVR